MQQAKNQDVDVVVSIHAERVLGYIVEGKFTCLHCAGSVEKRKLGKPATDVPSNCATCGKPMAKLVA